MYGDQGTHLLSLRYDLHWLITLIKDEAKERGGREKVHTHICPHTHIDKAIIVCAGVCVCKRGRGVKIALSICVCVVYM